MWRKSSGGEGESTVTPSTVNGRVKVNGSDITVYDETYLDAKATHSNRSTLDKFSEFGGSVLFNGSPVDSGGGIPSEITTTIKTNNLIDKDTVESGHYNITTGTFSVSTWKTSNYIDCLANDVLKTSTDAGNICFWDASKVFVSGQLISGGAVTITVPNVVSIRFITFTISEANLPLYMISKNMELPSVYVPYYVYMIIPKVKTSRVAGKKWNCLGDSITAEKEGYHKWLSLDYGVLPNNYGVIATTVGIRSGRTDSMLERYVDMAADADIITVLGGTNDFGAAATVPIGTLGNGNTSTFYGAYDALVVGIINKYPGKSIGLFTPIPRRSDTGSLADYADAVIAIGKKYAVPVLDLYRSSGLDPHINLINTTYFLIADGLHPNAEGHKILARRIIHFLESI